VKVKKAVINEVYVQGKRTGTVYGWMKYIEYRRKLADGAFGEEVEYPFVNVKVVEENGFVKEIDLSLDAVWTMFPRAMMAVIDKPVDVLAKMEEQNMRYFIGTEK